MNPLSLSQLIRHLQNAMDRHGDCAVYVEVPGDELDIFSVESHHLHSDATKPIMVCVSAVSERE